MLKGLYSAASGMIGLEYSTAANANNLANVNTAGFKRSNTQYASFAQMLVHRLTQQDSETIGSYSPGMKMTGMPVDYRSGEILSTGNPLDVAILEDDGFFAVQTPDGQERYTRNGQFSLNEDGFVVMSDGSLVLGSGGPIQIPSNATDIDIKPNGTVFAGGNQIDQLQVVTFEDKRLLRQVDNNQFDAGDQIAEPVTDINLQQGAFERSNVNVIQEMVNMIKGNREYEALRNCITTQDQSMSKTMELGQP